MNDMFGAGPPPSPPQGRSPGQSIGQSPGQPIGQSPGQSPAPALPLKAQPTVPLQCQVDITLPSLSLSSLARRGRGWAYRIGRVGPVAFSIDRPGMFALQGRVERVEGWLSVNSHDGAISELDFEVDPAMVSLRWTDMVADEPAVRGLPHLRFRSLATVGSSLRSGAGSGSGAGPGTRSIPGVLRGLLDIDGTPRLQTMNVTLLDRARDSITGTEIASYRLSGEIDLASFALSPEGSLLGDSIMVTLRVDVEINPGD